MIVPNKSTFREQDHYEVISKVQESGEFFVVKRNSEEVWDVMINPGYRLTESIKSTNTVQRKSLIITGIFFGFGVVFQIISAAIAYTEYTLHRKQDQKQELKAKADSLTIDGLKEKMISIQKRLDDMQKKETSNIKPHTP